MPVLPEQHAVQINHRFVSDAQKHESAREKSPDGREKEVLYTHHRFSIHSHFKLFISYYGSSIQPARNKSTRAPPGTVAGIQSVTPIISCPVSMLRSLIGTHGQ